MRPIRPFKPAPKNAQANRIRERYLHQLGLQRGGAPLTAPHLQSNNHVVVISGLPSLPEDRATTEHAMESHDFSISKHSQHTGTTPPGSVDGNSVDRDDMESDSRSAAHHSVCSKSTLSASPSTQREADENLTSMALVCPKALRKVPPPMNPDPFLNNAGVFPLSNSVPWRTSLSKPAVVLLDSADHDSVSSGGTSTTAESSLTAAMVSRDWSAVPPTTSAAASVSSQGGESPMSTPGVYFQCGHPRLLGGSSVSSSGTNCATSSLAHALNRFNIDSDCEASIASNSIVEDHIMDDDDASFDDNASRASVSSHLSTGSSKSQQIRARRKKIGKTQRLMDRASAHERIIQIRSNQSQKMRANVVNTQRKGGSSQAVSIISGLSSAMAQESHPLHPQQLSQSPGSTTSSQGSILMHVKHAAPSPAAQSPHLGDLGRTPTSSNCSDIRRLKQRHFSNMPPGVHINHGGPGIPLPLPNFQDADGSPSRKMAPLNFHPQLARQLPTPPPKLGGMIDIPNTATYHVSSVSESSSTEVAESREADDLTSLQHMDHQASIDDVMEVALTLSKLGGSRTGPIPRIR